MTNKQINDKIEPVNDKDNRGDLMIDKSKRNATQQRYHDKTYTKITLMLRQEQDKELISYIEKEKNAGKTATQVVRDLYKAVVK